MQNGTDRLTQNDPKILSRHAVGGLELVRFLTRFGDVVWLVSDPDESGHQGVCQGDRIVAINFLREMRTAASTRYARWVARQRS
jgi:hypothetical protein